MAAVQRLAPLLLTVVAGGLLSWQSEINGGLSDRTHSWLLAALVSFSVGTAMLSVLVFARSRGRAGLHLVATSLRARSLSWWVLAGGLLSAGYVVLQAGTVSTLGVAVFSLAAICGLNVGSIAVDFWGMSHGGGVPLTPRRVIAVVISLVAALLAVFPNLSHPSSSIVYFLLVVAAGIGASIQFAMTARVGETSGDSTVAAWVLFAIAAAFLLVLALAQGAFANGGIDHLLTAASSAPWLLIGGFLGATIVVINAFVVPRTGVLVFSLSLVAGQLLAAVLLDLASGSMNNVIFVVGGCALMLMATAVSVGGRGKSDQAPHIQEDLPR